MSQPGGRALKRTLISAAGVALALVVIVLQRGGHLPGSSAATPTSSTTTTTTPTTKATPTTSPRVVGSTPASPPSASSLRLASWNIEWLGKPEDRSGLARDIAQSPADLADYISASSAAIIALEEVVTRSQGFPLRSPEIEAALAKLPSDPQNRWQYVLFPGRAEGDQLTGLLWNAAQITALNPSGVAWEQTRDHPWALPIPKSRSAQGSALWNRPPHAMKFSAGPGKTDIVVIVLHMKADYNGDFAAHRNQESAALVRSLPDVRSRFKDNDIVLIGDTNCPGGPEPATKNFEAAGFTDLSVPGKQTHWQGGAMDRAFTPSDQPEFKRRTFEVLSNSYLRKRNLAPRDFKRRFSDHYMIVTTVDITADDD